MHLPSPAKPVCARRVVGNTHHQASGTAVHKAHTQVRWGHAAQVALPPKTSPAAAGVFKPQRWVQQIQNRHPNPAHSSHETYRAHVSANATGAHAVNTRQRQACQIQCRKSIDSRRVLQPWEQHKPAHSRWCRQTGRHTPCGLCCSTTCVSKPHRYRHHTHRTLPNNTCCQGAPELLHTNQHTKHTHTHCHNTRELSAYKLLPQHTGSIFEKHQEAGKLRPGASKSREAPMHSRCRYKWGACRPNWCSQVQKLDVR